MKKTLRLLAVAGLALVASCASRTTPTPAPGYQVNSFDNDLPLNEIPPEIVASAKAQIPGFRIEDAELQQRGTARLYELDGIANGRNYGITISADGRVLHVESQ